MYTEKSFVKAVSVAISAAPTTEAAAKAVYEICRAACSAWGMKPDIEVSIKAPGEPRHHSQTGCWSVVFEAGPYEWAIPASMGVDFKACKVYAEPYYSFDLSFYEA